MGPDELGERRGVAASCLFDQVEIGWWPARHCSWYTTAAAWFPLSGVEGLPDEIDRRRRPSFRCTRDIVS